MNKVLRVKLYGEAFKVHKLEIDSTLFQRFVTTAILFKEPLYKAILNINFFNGLNIDRYQSLNDVIKHTFSGLINNNKNRIEINYGRKRLEKLQLEELFRQKTLFPLYKTKIVHICTEKLSPGIYIEEVEIGLIGLYEIDVENFQIELLKFNLINIKISNSSYELLNAIYYGNRKLIKVKSDTLLRTQFSFQQL